MACDGCNGLKWLVLVLIENPSVSEGFGRNLDTLECCNDLQYIIEKKIPLAIQALGRGKMTFVLCSRAWVMKNFAKFDPLASDIIVVD